jgi:hypothetical protein
MVRKKRGSLGSCALGGISGSSRTRAAPGMSLGNIASSKENSQLENDKFFFPENKYVEFTRRLFLEGEIILTTFIESLRTTSYSEEDSHLMALFE